MAVRLNYMQSQVTGGLAPEGHNEDGDVCFYNIGPRERQKRMAFGRVALAIGIALGIALVVLDAAMGWRLALALVFTVAGTGFFQAREKTWVALAAQGVRNLDEGVEEIDDERIKAVLRRQGVKVLLYSIVFGLLLTVPFVLL